MRAASLSWQGQENNVLHSNGVWLVGMRSKDAVLKVFLACVVTISTMAACCQLSFGFPGTSLHRLHMYGKGNVFRKPLGCEIWFGQYPMPRVAALDSLMTFRPETTLTKSCNFYPASGVRYIWCVLLDLFFTGFCIGGEQKIHQDHVLRKYIVLGGLLPFNSCMQSMYIII